MDEKIADVGIGPKHKVMLPPPFLQLSAQKNCLRSASFFMTETLEVPEHQEGTLTSGSFSQVPLYPQNFGDSSLGGVKNSRTVMCKQDGSMNNCIICHE